CRNHALAAERARKREDLLRATERHLAPIAAAVRRKREPLRGKAEIGLAVGAVIDRHKMAKHFALEITDTSFAFARKTAEIAAEALRPSVVAKAQRSPTAVTKQTTGLTPDGLPVHSFHTLIADLATLTRNIVEIAAAPGMPFAITTRPTPTQKKAFDLLAVA